MVTYNAKVHRQYAPVIIDELRKDFGLEWKFSRTFELNKTPNNSVVEVIESFNRDYSSALYNSYWMNQELFIRSNGFDAKESIEEFVIRASESRVRIDIVPHHGLSARDSRKRAVASLGLLVQDFLSAHVDKLQSAVDYTRAIYCSFGQIFDDILLRLKAHTTKEGIVVSSDICTDLMFESDQDGENINFDTAMAYGTSLRRFNLSGEDPNIPLILSMEYDEGVCLDVNIGLDDLTGYPSKIKKSIEELSRQLIYYIHPMGITPRLVAFSENSR
ncbi:MAG: hypothetical protein ABIJ08_02145 [Nanoarchaeota archaeon]